MIVFETKMDKSSMMDMAFHMRQLKMLKGNLSHDIKGALLIVAFKLGADATLSQLFTETWEVLRADYGLSCPDYDDMSQEDQDRATAYNTAYQNLKRLVKKCAETRYDDRIIHAAIPVSTFADEFDGEFNFHEAIIRLDNAIKTRDSLVKARLEKLKERAAQDRAHARNVERQNEIEAEVQKRLAGMAVG